MWTRTATLVSLLIITPGQIRAQEQRTARKGYASHPAGFKIQCCRHLQEATQADKETEPQPSDFALVFCPLSKNSKDLHRHRIIIVTLSRFVHVNMRRK